MNEVVIYDESVSRHHAEILFQGNDFYLKDIGSTTGTYIKINEKITLEEGMIVEIGSYQFLVAEIRIGSQSGLLTDSMEEEEESDKSWIKLNIYEGPDETERMDYKLEEEGSIGRKTTNHICFTDDLHMSNLHCKISLINDRFVLEDMASTNGYF